MIRTLFINAFRQLLISGLILGLLWLQVEFSGWRFEWAFAFWVFFEIAGIRYVDSERVSEVRGSE